MSLPLSCTVRGCGAPLTRTDRVVRCTHGHTFDIARSGYISLLQPQDRRSRDAGDSRDAVRARSALVAAGVGRVLFDSLLDRIARLPFPSTPPVIVDLGCGAGEWLERCSTQQQLAGIGIDLSPAAADDAARRTPALTWVVANADRRLPLLDAGIDLITSIHARRNPAECHRVLRTQGFLLVAVPAATDLIELRELVQGEAVARDRVEALVTEHAPWFTVTERWSCAQTLDLERAALQQLLRGTYRGERFSQSPRVQQLEHLRVTLASDLVLFAPRSVVRT